MLKFTDLQLSCSLFCSHLLLLILVSLRRKRALLGLTTFRFDSKVGVIEFCFFD